jgi:hypothetical protein
MQLTRDTINAVFAAAVTARWTKTNLGRRADVRHNGTTYTVEIPTGYLAQIAYAEDFGGVDYVSGAAATLDQHIAVVDAAQAQAA